MVVTCLKVSIDVRPLLYEELFDRYRKILVFDPVETSGLYRPEATCNLMFALSTGIEPLKSLFDRIFDPLVEACLEVQAVKLAQRTPVATVEGFLVMKAERHRNTFALMSREGDPNGSGNTFNRIFKKLTC